MIQCQVCKHELTATFNSQKYCSARCRSLNGPARMRPAKSCEHCQLIFVPSIYCDRLCRECLGVQRKRFIAERQSWQSMHQRCSNPRHTFYRSYGGRGISVCDRWTRSFLSFIEDMGPRPSMAHTLDRVDNNGNYEPGNVRWATKREQGANRITTTLFALDGQTRSLTDWARIGKMSQAKLWYRIRVMGMSLDEAIKPGNLTSQK